MPAEQIVTELIVDARGAQRGTEEYRAALQVAQRAVDRFTAAQDKQRQADAAVGAAAAGAGQKIEQTARQLSYAERAANSYLGRLDPVFFASRRLADEQGRVEAALKGLDRQLMTGSITVAQFNQRSAQLTGRMGEVGNAAKQLAAGSISAEAAMGAMSTAAERNGSLAKAHAAAIGQAHDATGKATGSTGQMRFALQNLSFQLNDIATSLASGGSPMRVLAQQSGQVVQVFQQGGGVTAVLSAAGSAIRSMITPTTAAVAGVAALAGGVAVLLSRAGATEERLRSFDVILTGMGTRSNVTAHGLDQVVKSLRDTGTAADEALKAVQAFARVQGINPASASTLLPLSRDIGAATGQDMSSVAGKIAAAFAESTEAAIKLVYTLAGPNGLTAAEAANMKAMAAHGDRAGALRVAVDALQRQFGGGFQNAMSESEKAVNSLGAAWNNMLDNLGKTTVIQNLRQFFIKEMEDISKLLSRPPAPAVDWRAERNAIIQGANPRAGGYGFTPNYGVGGAISGRMSADTAAIGRLIELGATEAEIAILAQIRQRESGGIYNTFHATGATVSSLDEVRAFPGRSHAFGGYGFQPGTFDAMSARTGVSGISPGAQDANALALLRLYGPNSTASWAASAPRGGYGSGVFANVGQGAAAGMVPGGLTEQQRTALSDLATFNKKVADSAREVGESKVYWDAYLQAFGSGTKDVYDHEKAQQAAIAAVQKWRAGLESSAETQAISNRLTMDAATAYTAGLVPGLQAVASMQAQLNVRTGQASDYQSEYNRLLQAGAVEAAKTSAMALPALTEQVAATRRIADAELQGAAAVQEAERVEQVRAKTRDLAAQAAVAGDAAIRDGLTKQIELIDKISIQEKAAANARTANALLFRQQHDLNIALAEKQLALETDPARIQARQLAIQALQDQHAIRQQIKSDDPVLLEGAFRYAAAIRQTVAEAQTFNAIRDKAKSIADDIGQFFIDSFVNIDKGGKSIFANLMDAVRAGFKRMIANIAVDFAKQQFITPLMTAIVGGAPGLFGITSPANASGGGINAGTLLQGGGLLKDLFGIKLGGEGGLFGGVTNWLNNSVGTSLGFSGTDVVGFAGSDIGAVPTFGGSGLFGSTTFSQFLGGAGLGFGAGSLLNSLVGGNSTFGTIGSGLGSLAGAAIGSIIPGIGTLIGGLIGGAGGGLFGGLFGNKKPRNQSAGGNIDFATGRVFDMFSGGNAQIDQATHQVIQQLGGFTQRLLALSGGKLSGEVLLQNGVNTGFTADSSLPGFEGRFNLGRDPGEVVRTVSLALSRSLTDISDTMRRVIDQVSDPAALEGAIQFAAAYDNLKTAADSAFAELDSGTEKIGPFAQAMQRIAAIFGQMREGAEQFGLALEPVNAALAEATRRLQGDFTRALNTSLLEATGGGAVNQLHAVVASFYANLSEAAAIGLGSEAGTVADITRLFEAQVNAVLASLDSEQINQVVSAFAGLNATIVDLASASASAAEATADLAAAQEAANAIAQAGIQIREYLNSLEAVTSPYTSPEEALAASQAQYDEQLAAAMGGNVEALESITDIADQLIQNIAAYYGSTETGQEMVAAIEDELAALPGVPESTYVDSAVITNELLEELLGQTETIGTAQIDVANVNTQSLVDVNNQAAADMIAQNDASAAALIASNDETAAALIDQNDMAAQALIAQNDASAAALIAANDAASAGIIAQNDAAAQAMIAANDAAAAGIIAQNDVAAAELIAANDEAAAGIIAQNDAAAAALISANDAAAADIIAQNDASAMAVVAANDAATADLIAQYGASTEALLAGASEDAQAVGGAVQNSANMLAEIDTGLANGIVAALYDIANWTIESIYGAANSLIAAGNTYANSAVEAIYGAANSLIAAGNTYANGTVEAIYGAANSLIAALYDIANWTIESIYGAANSLIAAGNTYANSAVEAIYGAANSLIAAGNTYANGTVEAVYGAANSLISADNTYANSAVEAVYGAANSLIAAGNTYTNSMVDSIWGAANSLIATGATYANSTITAIYDAADSAGPQLAAIEVSNQHLAELTVHAVSLVNVTVAAGDTARGQRDTMIGLLTSILSTLSLSASGGGTWYDPGPGSDGGGSDSGY